MRGGCPLCGGPDLTPIEAQGRRFHDCGACGLVSVDRADLLSAVDERARYETHRNDPTDPGYRSFLDRLAIPLEERLTPGAEGLDFGSGPGPTLSLMLTERGFPTTDWDPFFASDPAPLGRTWDFVTATEVLEHLSDPRETLERIHGLVRPGGWFAAMTGVLDGSVDFATWWYVRDPTHVAFYRPGTLEWIAREFAWELSRPSTNVALWRKPA